MEFKLNKDKTLFENFKEYLFHINMSVLESGRQMQISNVALHKMKYRAPGKQTYDKLSKFMNVRADELMQLTIKREN